jgi:acetyl-CoA carboxylase carboxyltransferase component
VSIDVVEGAAVTAGTALLVMEAMKMQHSIPSTTAGIVRSILVAPGDTIYEGHALAYVEEADVGVEAAAQAEVVDLEAIRPDLAEVLERQALKLDPARPDAVAKRRKTGQRTARQNIDDLADPGTFIEYGSLVIAARRNRVPLDELIRKTPADGLITGLGTVNGRLFGEERARCAIVSYDYTVLAGTQGKKNHQKKDRIFEVAAQLRAPLVLFSEGGGGRPGDTDYHSVAGLWVRAFNLFAQLSGLVPLVGINSGRCFAGNAALLGCCDVVIATANSSIGMGGPAMIEGGGLGVFRPEEVGPMSIQVPNGTVDIAVADEAEAVHVAKKYLSYFQGPLKEWSAPDQRWLRRAVPENRLRVYDVRKVIDTLADTDSILEIRRAFGPGMVTVLARIEGMPVGIVANNPLHLAGAIDSDGADKAARFLQLCDAFAVPVVFLCDTPGMMVGPEVEKTALVRHCSRLFVTGANLSIPFCTVVLRKAYGLGAQAMAGGCFHTPLFSVAWPTGEFGGMGLEGSVKLGFRNELAAIAGPAERKALYDKMVAEAYARGKALSTATYFEIDEVIDPAETRRWILTALRNCPIRPRDGRKQRPNVDAW